MIAGHRTSVSVEDAFWHALGELAKKDGRSVPMLVAEIDARREQAGQSRTNLSAAIRLYVLDRLQHMLKVEYKLATTTSAPEDERQTRIEQALENAREATRQARE
jgi:predicted DNA-binding ribbon-helix-helix protein